MSWSKRKLLLALPLILAACGFEPVYAPGGTGAALNGRVEVSAPDTVESYQLVRTLENRLGRSSSPEYKLDVTVRTAAQGQAITISNEIERYSLVGEAEYSLTRISDGDIVASGDVRNFTGYSATGSTVDTLAAERDAQERLMTILADQITTQLFATADLSS
ncbi:LPS assembly lipoprotein LptE [Primorskyibacter sp. S87]|uniref:LPS assembly lipoprotein LptE n=1 Tax=Primorskyibacter sp. S87 TaxID=3415126 RepID=UPI003C7E4EB1